MKNPYKKYLNKYGFCDYPFDASPLGYCWGYASAVDKKQDSEELIRKMCENCEFYKPTPENETERGKGR